MNITFETFREVFTYLYEEKLFRDKYLATIPGDIVDAIFDNAYANSLACVNDTLVKTLFEEVADDVLWALWECKFKGDKISISRATGIDSLYEINTLEDYFDYVKREFDFS